MLKKVFASVEAQDLNALEIVEISANRIFGLHYVKIVALARHVKNSPFLRDLDPYYVPRAVWNGKVCFATPLATFTAPPRLAAPPNVGPCLSSSRDQLDALD